MKSVLVAKEFLTALGEGKTLADLTRGQLVLVDSAGNVLASAKNAPKDKMVQFVLGLGDGKVKHGAWLNPNNLRQHDEAPIAAGVRKYEFTDLMASRGIGYHGFDAEVVISCKPYNSFGGYPLEVYTASVTMEDITEDSASILARLNVELAKVIKRINKRFGLGSLKDAQIAESKLVLEGKAGFEFFVTLDGILKGNVTLTAGELPVGQYDQVLALEKEAAVAADGYNLNYEEYEEMYGDIFLAEKGKAYHTYVYNSVADFTHPFKMQTDGLIVTQFVMIEAKNDALKF